jgi:PAS domain S-box-containing protein
MDSTDIFFDRTTHTPGPLGLQDTLEFARALLDRAPCGMWVYRADGQCLSVNPAGERISGAPRAAILAQNFRSDPAWRSSGLLAAAERALASGGELRTQVQFSNAAAAPLRLDCRMSTLQVAGQTCLLLTAEELPPRPGVDPTIQAIFDAATEAIYLLDTAGVIQAINQTNAARLGRAVEDLVGRNFYDLLPSEVAAARRAANQRVIDSAQPLTYEDQRAGLWLENSVYPVFDERGQVRQLAIFSRDISARKYSEVVLKKQEENFRNLFENMLDGCAIHDIILDDSGKPVDYRFVAINPAFERLTGLKGETLIGRTVKEAMPGTEESWIEKYGRVALTGEPIHFEDYSRELDRTYEVSAYRSAPLQFAVSIMDISVRRRIEEALAISEDRLKLALQTAQMGVWDLNLLSGKVWRTLRHAQIFGYDDPQADWGFPIFLEHVIPEDRAYVQRTFNQALVEGSLHMVCRILRIDFVVRWVSITGQVYRGADGTPVRMLGTVLDITESKQVETDLFNSRQMLRLVIDTMPQRVFWKNRELRYLGCNRAFAADLGSSGPAGVVGKTDEEMAWQAGPAADREVMESGADRLNEELLQTQADGALRWLRFSRVPLRDPDGQTFGVLGMYDDITAQKEALALLEERTRDLQRSNAELEQFAYIASHDLQEPLRMVASFSQLLARRYQGQLDKNADEYIQFITEGAVRMQRLINDLLAFSRVGTRGAPFKKVLLEKVLHEVQDNLQVTINETSAEIIHAPLPVVLGDETQLAQVLQNLIANAIKFRSNQPLRIYIGAAREADEWVISVRDNGIGIPTQYFERIFVIFQRLHNRDQYPGNGIGLAICKKIVERHGGRIWVDSITGQGSTFSFTIPAK